MVVDVMCEQCFLSSTQWLGSGCEIAEFVHSRIVSRSSAFVRSFDNELGCVRSLVRELTCRLLLRLSSMVQSMHRFLKWPRVYNFVQCYRIPILGGAYSWFIAFETLHVHGIFVMAHVLIGKPHVDLSVIPTPSSWEGIIDAGGL